MSADSVGTGKHVRSLCWTRWGRAVRTQPHRLHFDYGRLFGCTRPRRQYGGSRPQCSAPRCGCTCWTGGRRAVPREIWSTADIFTHVEKSPKILRWPPAGTIDATPGAARERSTSPEYQAMGSPSQSCGGRCGARRQDHDGGSVRPLSAHRGGVPLVAARV
jgi:hypothetical protein